MILKFYGNNRKSTSGRKDCIKRKNTELKSSVLKDRKFGYKAKAMFSGAVYFRDALCNDKPRRKEKIGGLFSLFYPKKVDGGGCYAILIIRYIISPDILYPLKGVLLGLPSGGGCQLFDSKYFIIRNFIFFIRLSRAKTAIYSRLFIPAL